MKQVKKAGTTESVPVDDQCEECFHIHKHGFMHLSWEELCKLNENDPGIRQQVTSCRAGSTSQGACPELPEEVVKFLGHAIEVRRSWVVLSESEMRKATSMKRLNKATIGQLPSVTIPAEDGKGEEQVFVFSNPDRPYRTLDVVSLASTHHTKFTLPQSKIWWQQQADKAFTHMSSEAMSTAGITSTIEKEKGGHLKSLQEWLNSKGFSQQGEDGAMPDQPEEGEGKGAAAASDEEEEDGAALSGVAARMMEAPREATVESHPRTPCAKKGPSWKGLRQQTPDRREDPSASLAASPVDDGASAAGTEMSLGDSASKYGGGRCTSVWIESG